MKTPHFTMTSFWPVKHGQLSTARHRKVERHFTTQRVKAIPIFFALVSMCSIAGMSFQDGFKSFRTLCSTQTRLPRRPQNRFWLDLDLLGASTKPKQRMVRAFKTDPNPSSSCSRHAVSTPQITTPFPGIAFPTPWNARHLAG